LTGKTVADPFYTGREGEEAGVDRLHAETVDHLERDGEKPDAVAGCRHSASLIFRTVAVPFFLLGWHIVKDGEASLSTNRLKVIVGSGPNVNDLNSGLLKDLVNKGVTPLSIFSLVRPVV